MYGDCEVCSFKGQKYDERREGNLLTMFGGYPAKLCNACLIAWHEVCLAMPEYTRLREIEVDLGAMEFRSLSKDRSTREADQLAERYSALCREAHAVKDAGWKKSQAWVAARKASGQPASTPAP